MQDFPVKCLHNTLKTITIYGFTGRTTEVEMLKFLLQKAMVLETLYLRRVKVANNLQSTEVWESTAADIYNNHIGNETQIASDRFRLVIS